MACSPLISSSSFLMAAASSSFGTTTSTKTRTGMDTALRVATPSWSSQIPLKTPPSFFRSKNPRLPSPLIAHATPQNQNTKVNSIVCADCDGNGAKQCTQCKGTGINSIDHFNGHYKAGQLCWLCRGKREILCGDCNGAGFLGGFMSTLDD